VSSIRHNTKGQILTISRAGQSLQPILECDQLELSGRAFDTARIQEGIALRWQIFRPYLAQER
jgi:hypothetical protein